MCVCVCSWDDCVHGASVKQWHVSAKSYRLKRPTDSDKPCVTAHRGDLYDYTQAISYVNTTLWRSNVQEIETPSYTSIITCPVPTTVVPGDFVCVVSTAQHCNVPPTLSLSLSLSLSVRSWSSTLACGYLIVFDSRAVFHPTTTTTKKVDQ